MTFDAAIAANRFGLGARPGELSAIGQDARDWLARQVEGPRPTPEAVRGLPSSAKMFATFVKGQQARREQRQDEAAIAQNAVQNIRKQLVPLYLDQIVARYATATRSEESFRERLVHFWTNHFAISADKPQVLALAGTLENEVIRPALAGSFADLLLAVEAHPAMILYLDNQASIGPNSQLAMKAQRRARGRKLDINENLAREILELHTLGVSGYTQTDVTTFAQVLTGWSVGGGRGPLAQGEPGKFVFRELAHEPGAKTVLGKRYTDDGIGQARAVLHDLARHPSTATHIATKLVRHFVADEPPADAVARVAQAFIASAGDLPSVHRSLIDLRESWQPTPAKFKTPHEYVVSVFRAVNFVPGKPQQVAAPFELLGQRPYSPGSPAGWPDTAAQWDGPDALLKRIEWASQVGERIGVRVNPLYLADQSLGAALTEHTRTAVARSADTSQGLTLLLSSPEFLRR
ncbi:MAG: DUF1800 domain-containing protein [Steroidobacteraceae bacterium]